MNRESVSPPRWKVGECILGLYEIEDVHDAGGMGIVYKARHTRWDEYVAIKAPRTEAFLSADQKQRYIRECETWIDLGLHPNIVACYYVRTIDSVPHIFAEYAFGGSLHEWITRGQFSLGAFSSTLIKVLDIGIQFAWGLCHAHAKNVIHRDVKPGNVMMTSDGIPKITDFGLASSEVPHALFAQDSIQRGMFVSAGGMTPVYCSPEQAAGLPVTRKTDIWSWAVSILEMLMGAPQWGFGFKAGTFLRQALDETLPGPRLQIPSSLAYLLRRCLRENPDYRPESMDEVADEMQKVYVEITQDTYKRAQPRHLENTADELNNQALSFWDIGNVQAAMESLTKAKQADSKHVTAAYNDALLRWTDGRITDCEATARLLDSRSDPKMDTQRCYFIGLLELESGRLIESRTNLEKSESVSTTTVRFYCDQVSTALSNVPRCVQVFSGHKSVVTSVRSYRGSQMIISGSEDRSIGIWEISSGARLQTLTGHTDCVYGIAVIEDKNLAVSASQDGTLRVWSTATGECLDVLSGHVGRVTALSVIDALDVAVSGGDDCTVRTWRIPRNPSRGTFLGKLSAALSLSETAQPVVLRGHAKPVVSVCACQRGNTVLSGDMGGTIRVWDLATRNCIHVLQGHTDSVNGLSISRNGEFALSASSDCTIRVWCLDTYKCSRVLRGHTSWVCCVDFSPDGEFAVSGSEDNTVRLWELKTGKCLRTLEGHSAPVYSVCYEEDGTHCISASEDHTMRRWDISLFGRRRPRAPLQLCKTAPIAAAFAEQNIIDSVIERAEDAKCRGDIDGVLRLARQARSNPHFRSAAKVRELWVFAARHSVRQELQGAWFARSFNERCGAFTSLQLSPDLRWLMSSSSAYTPDLPGIALWDLRTGTHIREIGVEGEPTQAAEFVPGTPYILCVGPNSGFGQPPEERHYHLVLWDASTGQCVRRFVGHKNNVWSVSVSGDGQRAISTSVDKTARLWDVATGDCIRVFTDVPDIFRTVISPDGQYALSGKLRLWNLSSRETTRVFERESCYDVKAKFSNDGQLVVTSSESYPAKDNTARLWDVSTGQCIRTFCGHDDAVTDA